MATKSRSDGEGSIYQRHDAARYGCPPLIDGQPNPATGKPTTVRPAHKCTGPWVGVLVLGYRDKGKPVRKKVTAHTKAAAAGALRELREKCQEGDLPDGSITVSQWMDYWTTRIVPRKAAETTAATYTQISKQYVIPLMGHHRLERLTPEHIDEAWESLLDVGNPTLPKDQRVPLSPNTVHLAHTVFRRALKVAVQRKRLKINPAGADSMDAPPREDNEIEPIPEADIEKILAVAKTDAEYGARWSVALALGLRPGEVLGLTWRDVDVSEGILTVRQQLQWSKGNGLQTRKPKSRAGGRSMYLPDKLLASLKAHKKAQNALRLKAGDQWHATGHVFTLADGRVVDPSVDRRRWKALLEKADVQHRRLYDARHSAATLLLAQGVELRVAMELLGHSQVSVTMRYMHAVDDLKAQAAKKINAGFLG